MNAKCRLCLKEAELRKSHIYPEFLYLSTYDEIHRAVKVTPNHTQNPPYIQKGLREYLLCQVCEVQLSKYEGYAAKTLKRVQDREPQPNSMYIEIKAVDYKLLKLFQMSLLWRASVTSLEEFVTIPLGEYEEDLRAKILEEKPGESFEYGCLMMLYPYKDNVEKIIFTPVKEELAGKVYYRFHTGPWFWYFLHPGQFQDEVDHEFFLSESGDLRVLLAQWSEEDYLHNLRNQLFETWDPK